MRTIISLDKKQMKDLTSYAESKGVSRALVVREALAVYLPSAQTRHTFKDHPSFGSWQSLEEDGVDYIRNLRSEWDKRG